MRLGLRLLLAWALLAVGGAAWAQPVSCALVLMHGKWGMPQSPYLKPVVQKIQPHCQVKLLEMPWSRQRMYDRPYDHALAQIQQTVTELRQSGVQWVAVGGQSFGANASLAYWAEGGDADALVPMAPGHVPEVFANIADARGGIDAVRQRFEAGQGEDLVTMTDINQGQRRAVTGKASALWSYFNPQGLGNMALSAQKAQSTRQPLPVFWAIGTQDPLYTSGSREIYQKLPIHPDSLYLVVNANHANTPEAAADDLWRWLKARTGR